VKQGGLPPRIFGKSWGIWWSSAEKVRKMCFCSWCVTVLTPERGKVGEGKDEEKGREGEFGEGRRGGGQEEGSDGGGWIPLF